MSGYKSKAEVEKVLGRNCYFWVRLKGSKGGCLFDSRKEAEEEVAHEEAENEPEDRGDFEIVEEWMTPEQVERLPEFDGSY